MADVEKQNDPDTWITGCGKTQGRYFVIETCIRMLGGVVSFYIFEKILKMKPIIIFLSIALIFSCKKDDDTSVTPEFKIYNVTISEDEWSGVVKITLTLSEPADKEVSINYSTSDSTAIAGDHYQAVTGTLVFNPGVTTNSFSVSIYQDAQETKDLVFHVNFSSPVNGILNKDKIRVIIKNVDYESLIWSDEFDQTLVNTNNWNFEIGNNNGWGNNELQNYTNSTDNVYTDSGYLHIKAIKTPQSTYTSARITTLNKQQYTYGRIEIRAKMPVGQGIWPALWMLGSNISEVNWPRCGEIDIMEYLGHQPDKVYGTFHWDENGHKYIGGNIQLSSGSFHDDFHTFTLIWTPNKLKWLVDGEQMFEAEKRMYSAFPFDLPQFLIFNVAVGGNWPGYPDGTTIFPQTMIIDYVRWYQ